MKPLLLLLMIIAITSFAQKTDAELTDQVNVIREETEFGGNTKGRVADMYQAIIDSKVSRKDVSISHSDAISDCRTLHYYSWFLLLLIGLTVTVLIYYNIAFRRFFRRLFLTKIEFAKEMVPGSPILKGYLLGYIAIPTVFEIKTIKRVDHAISKEVAYMAIVEPRDPDEISTGHFEHRNIIIPQGQIKIL